jgi:hypothetical protein
MAMKKYETPCCEVDLIDMETSFLTGASAEGFPVDQTNPFESLITEADYA